MPGAMESPLLGELVATLRAENVTEAELASLEELIRTIGPGPVQDALAHVRDCVLAGEDIAVFAKDPEPADEWDGYESQRDMLAATIYNVRAQSPREMTPARWARIKSRFGASARQCLERADEEIADL